MIHLYRRNDVKWKRKESKKKKKAEGKRQNAVKDESDQKRSRASFTVLFLFVRLLLFRICALEFRIADRAVSFLSFLLLTKQNEKC